MGGVAFVNDPRQIADYVRRYNEGLRAAQERYEREQQAKCEQSNYPNSVVQ